MNPSYLTPDQLAERWRVTRKTLSQWRYNGRGPLYSKVSRLVTYWLKDIEQFENCNLCQSTTEYPLIQRRPPDRRQNDEKTPFNQLNTQKKEYN